MTKKEKDKLMEILPTMLKYLQDNPASLISKIFGIYRVKMPGVVPVYLCLQQNCLNIDVKNSLISIFDMKGSAYKRRILNLDVTSLTDTTIESETPNSTFLNLQLPNQTILNTLPKKIQTMLNESSEPLKDIDFIYLREYYPKVFQMNFHPEDEQQILDSLEGDSTFLRDLKLMDYSILIGIEEIRHSESMYDIQGLKRSSISTSSSHQFVSKCEKFIYHISLIDYLQTYNLRKKMEVVYKSRVKNAKTEEISSMNPTSYQERFFKFIKS